MKMIFTLHGRTQINWPKANCFRFCHPLFVPSKRGLFQKFASLPQNMNISEARYLATMTDCYAQVCSEFRTPWCLELYFFTWCTVSCQRVTWVSWATAKRRCDEILRCLDALGQAVQHLHGSHVGLGCLCQNVERDDSIHPELAVIVCKKNDAWCMHIPKLTHVWCSY